LFKFVIFVLLHIQQEIDSQKSIKYPTYIILVMWSCP